MEKRDFFAKARNDLTGPLAGVLVIEATTTWAGPMAGCVLGDFGARVIKVEHPDGEVIRRLPPLIPGTEDTVADQTVNRNKENVSLKLSTTEGREIFLKLCAMADIVIENFRPGTLADWGVDYQSVAAVKPDIVYVSISGFGQFGTLSDRVGYDPLAQNYSGWASLNGDPDGGPMKAPSFLGDDLGGLHGALGAMAALRHRDQTGEGQHVDIALIDGLLYQSNGYLTSGALGIPMPRFGNQFGIAAPVNSYVCIDGNVYAGVLLDSHWRVLAGLLERADLAALTLPQRIEQRDMVDGLLRVWCAERSVAEVVDVFAAYGLPATRVNTYAEVSEEPHVASRDMLVPVGLADGREVPVTGPAWKLSRTPLQVRSRAPKLGEHNDGVYAEIGLNPEELAELKAKGVI